MAFHIIFFVKIKSNVKKIAFFFGVLISIIFLNSIIHAQRIIDIEAVLKYPSTDTQITAETLFPFSVVLKNKGPDALISGDTLAIYPEMGGGNQIFPVFLTKGIAVGEEVVVFDEKLSLRIEGNEQVTTDLCVIILDPNSSGFIVEGKPFNVSYDDPNTDNNRTCNRITINPAPTLVRNMAWTDRNEVIVYPNPASVFINLYTIMEQRKMTSVCIKDITGKEVVSKNYEADELSKQHPGQLNIEGLASGIYLLELNSGKNKMIRKLTIQH